MNTAEQAAFFVRRMVHDESTGWGDEAGALRRIAHASGLPFWTLERLRIQRAKRIDADVWGRLREHFIQHCRRHAERLLHEAELAQQKAPANDDLAIVADEIRALASRLDAAKAQAKGPLK